jgi:hypothetical protein
MTGEIGTVNEIADIKRKWRREQEERERSRTSTGLDSDK